MKKKIVFLIVVIIIISLYLALTAKEKVIAGFENGDDEGVQVYATALCGTTIVVSERFGKVRAFNINNLSDSVWETGEEFVAGYGTPFCDESSVVIPGEGDLYNIRKDDGIVRWSFKERNPGLLEDFGLIDFTSVIKSGSGYLAIAGFDDESVPDNEYESTGSVFSFVFALDSEGRVTESERIPNSVYTALSYIPEFNVFAFGSGGYFRKGALHIYTYDTEKQSFSEIARIDNNYCNSGFISSQTGDKKGRFAAADFCGNVFMVDISGEILWRKIWKRERETKYQFLYSSPVFAKINDDAVLDVVLVPSTLRIKDLNDTFSTEPDVEVFDDIILPALSNGAVKSNIIALNGSDGSVLWNHAVPGIALANPIPIEYLAQDDKITKESIIAFTSDFNLCTEEKEYCSSGIYTVKGKNTDDVTYHGETEGYITPIAGDFTQSEYLDLLIVDGGGDVRTEQVEEFSGNARAYSGFRGPDGFGMR